MNQQFNNSTSSLKIIREIGGIRYILSYLEIYIPYTILSIIGVILGIMGNVLIISSILIKRDLRKNPACILILNLAFADLTISLFVNSSTVVGVYLGKAFFDRNMVFCVFLAAACMVACATSLVTMGFLAINRYICIFYNNNYSRYFSVRNTIFCCGLTWTLGIGVDLPNFFGIGAHVYDTKALSCLFDRLKVVYTMAFAIGCIIIPCFGIGFLYLKIFCHAFNMKQKIVNRDDRKKHRSTMEAIKIAKGLFASFFIFSACWIPVSIIFIVGRDDHLPISAHAFTNLPAHLNSAINPIFYGIFNPKIREGYRNFMNILTCNKHFRRQETSKQSTKTNNTQQLSMSTRRATLNLKKF